jgi:hypothetical protein
MKSLRTLLWVYLWLLIFEGSLRKWIVPSLDTPLLIIRDPLVMLIYFQAWRNRLSFGNAFFLPNLVLAVVTALTATFYGHGNVFVTLYGLRTDFLQIPLIFLIPQILDRDDVILMGRFFLYIVIPIAVLVTLQFLAAPDSWVNKGAMTTHYGSVRPSGPFSFIAGLVSFFSLVSSFLLFGFIEARTYKVWLLALGTFATLIASACSGSRSCLVSIGLVVVVAILCVVARGKGGMGMAVAAVLIAVAFPMLSALPVFQEGSLQLERRFVDAGVDEGNTKGFLDRYAGTMLVPITTMGNVPFFGNGLGIGTNAATGILHGVRGFMGPEDEWGRLIFESGPVLGLLLCIFRIALTVTLARQAFAALRQDNILSILIFAACGLTVLNGQWGVPTTLGFAIFASGLTLAAGVDPPEPDRHDDEEQDPDAADESDRSTAADALG